jgi:hypothetical protein
MISREQLVKIFEQNKLLGKGVEIGSFKGEYAKNILNFWSGDLYLIDVWRELNINDYQDSSNQYDYKNIINSCLENIKQNEHRCFMIRSDSVKASELFNDQSLDFIYIDANHKYEFVKKDMEKWFPKLRYGGIFSGHDYLKMNWYSNDIYKINGKDSHIWTKSSNGEYDNYAGQFGVNPAVDEFCKKNGYKFNLTEEWFSSWYFTK